MQQSLMEQLAIDAQGMPFASKMIAGLMVTLFSMVIVFAVLILLMYVIKALGAIVTAGEKKSTQASVPSAAPAAAVSAPAVQADDSQVVAAIVAAVSSSYAGSDVRIVIKDIVKKQDNWGTVGLLEQMNSRL